MKISKRVRIYLWLSHGFSWISRFSRPFPRISCILQSFWHAIWLGFLDAKTLNEITWSFYIGKSGFETENFNIHQGLWPWEADAVRNHLKNKKRVLVAGAGGGREVIALARLGHDVTAFDFSSYLTKACRRNLERAGCLAYVLYAPPNECPKGLKDYDALLIGRGFYHHIPGRTRRIAFLKACRASLNVGAPIILSDFFTRPVDSRFYLRTQRIANFLRRLQRHSEYVELGDWLSNCMQHAFTREEIEQELVEAGIKFEVFKVSPFSEDSHLAHVIGRAS